MLAKGRKKNCAKACCGTAALAASANTNGRTAFPLNDRIVSSLFKPSRPRGCSDNIAASIGPASAESPSDCLSLQRKSGTKLARRYVSVADLKAALAFESSVSFSRPPLDTRPGQRK
jgi:hypothetical protein